MPRLHSSGIRYCSKRRGFWGEDPFCAKSLSAIWGPCVQHDCLPAWGGTKPELSGVWWTEAQEFPGFPSLCPGMWYALGQG